MYRPGGDTHHFRPVPAAPPPLRMMPPPLVPPPPSMLPPPGRPLNHLPPQGRPGIPQQYIYPPPTAQPPPPPPLLAPPQASFRGPPPSMHPPMQPNLPSMQRPLPMLRPPNMPPSIPVVQSSLPLSQPPPPLQSSFPSLQPSLPSVRPISTSFQPPLMHLPPPPSFVPTGLLPIQPPAFLPPLPPSPPSENPPPPPPSSPPPQPPPLLPTQESSSTFVAGLLPPEPPKPSDPEMLKNIDVLAAFVAKNGPRFESMARARQAGDPKFAFLFDSDASPEAAIGHEFYKWKKQSFALELGLGNENKKNNQADLGAIAGRVLHAKAMPSQPMLSDDIPASPAMSDMDMEDDFLPSPVRDPVEPLGVEPNITKEISTESEAIRKNSQVLFGSTNDLLKMQKLDGSSKQASQEETSQGRRLSRDANEALVANLHGKNSSERRLMDGADSPCNGGDADGGNYLEQPSSWEKLPKFSGGDAALRTQEKSETQDFSENAHVKHPERRMGRVSRWESLPFSHMNEGVEDRQDGGSRYDLVPHNKQDGHDQNDEESKSPRHDCAFDDGVARVKNADKAGEGKAEDGRPPDLANPDDVSVDEFGRLVQKEAVDSDSDEDIRPRKRRRSYSRSRSRSRSRGIGRRSRSRGRSRSRSRSNSPSYSHGESRWRRPNFSRSPRRRGRRSRSRSFSPGHWQHNGSRSPSRDMRWGGMGRGDRDWRVEREPYGRGRRGGRGSGPSICFHYARGRCFRGSECRFLHPEKEIAFERGEHDHRATLVQKATIRGDPYQDQSPKSKEGWPGEMTEQVRWTDSFTEDVNRTPSNDERALIGVSMPLNESAKAEDAAGPQAVSEATMHLSEFSSLGNKETINMDGGIDTTVPQPISEAGKLGASKDGRMVANADNNESVSTNQTLEISDSLKVAQSTRKDVDKLLDQCGDFEAVEKLPDGASQRIPESELEGVVMSTRSQSKDSMEEAMSPTELSRTGLHEKSSPMIDHEKLEKMSDMKATVEKPIAMADFDSESEMPDSENITRTVSGSLSPTPDPRATLVEEHMHAASISMNSDLPTEQRNGPILRHLSGQHSSPTAKMSSPQLQTISSPTPNAFTNTTSSISVGNFKPSHLLSSQAPSALTANAGAHYPFSSNNSEHTSFHRESLPRPSHGAPFLPHLGFSQNTSQQSLLPPQDGLPPDFTTYKPGQFTSRPSMLQRPFSANEQQEWRGSFPSSTADSSYAHSYRNDERQYMQPNSASGMLQHAYSRPGIIGSAAPASFPMTWKDDSLAASRPMSVLNAEQPQYSYTLTTIPPLPNLIKLPGASRVAASGEQYDPLSDVLDLGPSSALKDRPPGDGGRPVGVGFLENVSPGSDPEKANKSAFKPDVDIGNTNEVAADVGVVENVSPPGEWSPVQPEDEAIVSHDQLHSKSKKSSRGLKLLRSAVADRVKTLLKVPWKEGRLSKDAFKTIAKKAVEKVTGNLPSHHIPKSQEKVDQFMAVSSSKIAKLVQGYVDKYSKVQS